MTPLAWLEFDFSEDAEGHGSFDAMAAAGAGQWPALQAEVLRVLAWAEDTFPRSRGPLEEGGTWDYELQGVEEVATTLQVDLAADGSALEVRRGTTGAPRLTLSLTVSGTAPFCDAMREAFQIL